MQRWIIALGVTLACALGAQAALANLIANGEFDEGLHHWHASSSSAINVRTADDSINTATATSGFDGFFGSDFVVLGDRRGTILSRSGPDEGTFELLSRAFTLSAAARVQVSFQAAFDGMAGYGSDYFQVAIVGADDCPPLLRTLLKAFLTDSGGLSWTPFLSSVDLLAGEYRLLFRLFEAHGHRSNGAVGIDGVSVEIGAVSEVPLPASAVLMASALTGLLALRRRVV
jgi:hypothetical protein